MDDIAFAVNSIRKKPYLIARDIGFTDVREYPHNDWMRNILTGEKDYTLLAHRGSYKSSVLSVCIALLMVLTPDKNIIFLRKADNDVTEMIRMVKKALESNVLQAYAMMIYHKRLELIESTASTITTNLFLSASGSSQLLGIGLKSSITGKHGDIVITDDICNISDRISKAERDRTKLQYQELQNIRNRGGRIINTGTRWHNEDVYTLMDNIHTYDCYETKLISNKQIEAIRKSMSPSLFSCNYELQIIAAENALFTTAPTYATDEIAQEELKRANATAPELLFDGIAHIDAAYGGEDYTAFTCGKRRGDKLYMFGKMWHGHVDTVIDYAIAQCQRLRCAPIHLEVNADKGFVAREIIRRGYKASVYSEPDNKYVKISTYLRKWWNNIVWLEGTDPEYINQILDYTQDAEHDDAPDSAACVCRYYDNRKK